MLTQKIPQKRYKSVFLTQRVHLFPFRTQKLSSAVLKILVGRPAGKISQCRHNIGKRFLKRNLFSYLCISPKGKGETNSEVAIRYASLAQLAEHVTVNHGVVGSSPSRGAKTKDHPIGGSFVLLFCDRAQIDGLSAINCKDVSRQTLFRFQTSSLPL